MVRESGGFVPEAAEAKKIIAQEMKTEEELIQYFIVFFKNDPGIANDEEKITMLARILAKQTLELAALGADVPHYFGAYDKDKVVGVGKLVILKDKNKHKYGYLSELIVSKEHRGKEVSKFLTDARMGCARENGCEYLGTDVLIDNPVGLVTKFKDGFILTDCKLSDGLFVLSKKINGQEDFDRHNGPVGELKEILFTDLSAIENYVKQGWSGIDVKNIGNVRDNSPDNWLLILEKSSK